MAEQSQKNIEIFKRENKENNLKQTEIGSIPEDWEVVRLGEVLKEVDIRVKNLKNVNPENLTVLSLTKNYGLIPQTKRFKKRIAVKDVANYKIVRKLQIVHNPYVIWEGAIHALRTMEIGIVSPVYCVWECKNNSDPSFIDRLLRTPKLLNEYLARASGVVNRRRSVSKDDFLNIKIPLPPLPEQRKIARVLDKIQQAIELQDRIIEQAKNLKKSLMQKLFTEGFYGEEQKETEIGLIPKSWEVVRLGEIGIFEYGYTETALEEDTGIKFLRITDIKDNGLILWNEVPYCKISETKFKKYQLKNGDILFARIGATTGKTCFIESPPKSVFASYLITLKIKTDVYKKFVYYYTQTPIYWSQVEANKEGKLKKGISATLLRTFKIPLPPLEEQKQIAHILSVLDKKIEVEQKRKQVLKELFKTMLHKLMSGKIRLKEVEI
ncbi:restriction modification system DNA specificity subunit [Candidatus Desulfofervidus auxilii]|uniref:Restriction modification system DNA specificity subunit n=1 Tax=Desulfofervidus auxilii TaxID=1621989 RepID=A0A7U4QJU7_DESA2|nr:restriction endonuclease subunit S [Candidatus Desulfofervidus auxilii]AMM40676.1 restriction modification system DNA specificity subunit [Candidatus Desulfofervidus auxilii]CAD7773950.1 Type I restriction modification DNA specificity domain protein [Candidatus Methanoperedenaceae archaeon GB50]CAD7775240.1 Type I restriction modification DNA specificity domain protein [Candidatus Methanoperedenaceae archaeon GB37]